MNKEAVKPIETLEQPKPKRLTLKQAEELGIVGFAGSLNYHSEHYSYDDNDGEHEACYPPLVLKLAMLVELPERQINKAIRNSISRDSYNASEVVVDYAVTVGDKGLAERAVKSITFEERKYPALYKMGYVSQTLHKLDQYIAENKYYENDKKIALALLMADKFPGRARQVLEQGCGSPVQRMTLAEKTSNEDVFKSYLAQYEQLLIDNPNSVSIYFYKNAIVRFAKRLGRQDIVDSVIKEVEERADWIDPSEMLAVAYELKDDEDTVCKILKLIPNEYFSDKVAEYVLNLEIKNQEFISWAKQQFKKNNYALALLAINDGDYKEAVVQIKNSIKRTGLLIPAAHAYMAMARRILAEAAQNRS